MSVRRLLYHGAVYGFTSATARFLNWALTPLYAHRLTLEDFGRLSELYSWMVFGLIAAGVGMETAYFRFGVRGQEASAAAFWRMLGITGAVGGGLAVLLALAVPTFAAGLGYAEQPHLLWLTIAIWTVDAWGSFALAYQRATGRPWRFAAIQLSHVGLLLVLNIWGVGVKGWGLSYILAVNLAASLIRLGWALVWGPRLLRALSEGEAPPAVNTLLRYGLLLALMGLLGATNDVLDRVLLARYDLTETALYSAAYKVAMALALFVQAYRQAGEPLLLGENRGDRDFYRRSWLLYHGIALTGVLLLGLWAPKAVTTTWGGLLPKPILPPVYHAALEVLPILLWANLLMGSLVQASIWYKLGTDPSIGVAITAIGSGITWIGNLYGIPRYGYIASAWTTLIAYAVMVSLSVALGRRVLVGAFPLWPLGAGALIVGGALLCAPCGSLWVSVVGLAALSMVWLGLLCPSR